VDHPPETVSTILESRGDAGAVATRRDLLSFSPIALGSEPAAHPASADRKWFLLMAHDRAPIDTPIRHLTVFLSVVTSVVAVTAGVLGVLVGHYLTRPVAILRRATREVAADLSKLVEVTTGDEIEGLANDFNVMIEQLREAQNRLSAWNAELEREVARKTDDLHKLQGGLARAEKLASIGQMTASVMHEIGNPLAAIKTRIQVAEEEENPVEHFQSLLADILDEVNRLTVFLRSFCHLSRLREPRMEITSSEAVVQGVITLISPELRRQGVTLRVESAADAPSIFGDPDQLRQLLINLLLNAAESSSSGTEILVTVGPPTSHAANRVLEGACIEVLDHGAGMSEEVVKSIWDPFFTTRADGTGLGLAICRQIVEDHRGTIRVQSQPDEGTLVTVTFPDAVAERLSSARTREDHASESANDSNPKP
jgi:signal transduction histidine kinase